MENTEKSLRYVWDRVKTSTISVTGVPERREREWGRNSVWKDYDQEFSKLKKDVNYDSR